MRRFVVVGRGGEDGVDSGTSGDFLGFLHGFVRRVGRGSGNDRNAPRSDFDRGIDDVEPFVVGQRGRFASGAAGNEEINSRIDLPGDETAQARVVDGAVLMKRRDESGTAASELHRDRITRMESEGKLNKRVNKRVNEQEESDARARSRDRRATEMAAQSLRFQVRSNEI